MVFAFDYDGGMQGKRNEPETPALPPKPGTYALVLEAIAEKRVQIGRLGVLHVRPGIYVYVGSALGPGGLAARVGRHARREKTRRWHIDYLRAETRLVGVWFTTGTKRQECRWSAIIGRASGAQVLQDGFGASDCRCRSHLYHFPDLRSVDAIRCQVKCQVRACD
jgi:Uri superfamily endonuclease